ncbi:hypothetical protein HK405_015526, partial [Cladochytrium tenue]
MDAPAADAAASTWTYTVFAWFSRAALFTAAFPAGPVTALPAHFRAVVLPAAAAACAASAAWGAANSALSTSLRAPLPRVYWNTKATTFVILLWTGLIAGGAALISGQALMAASQATGHRRLLPNFGLRDLALSRSDDLRAIVLTAGDSHLGTVFPDANVTAEEAAWVALGAWHTYLLEGPEGAAVAGIPQDSQANASAAMRTSADVFSSRFPQTAEAVIHYARGRTISALSALGPAIGEVRWMGASALSESAASGTEGEVPPMERPIGGVSREDLDPTNQVLAAVGPVAIDLVFQLLVFYSTLWVLVASEQGGTRHYVAQLLGSRLTAALLEPLDRAVVLNAQLVVCRVSAAQLVAFATMPRGTRGAAAAQAFVAAA